MNSRRPIPNSGAALVMVLLIVILSGALVAGWLATHSAQTAYVDTLDESSRRRVACANLGAFARARLLNFVVGSGGGVAPSGTDISAAVSQTVYDHRSPPVAMGTVTIDGTTATPLESESRPGGWNHFNWGSGGGYTTDLNVVMTVTEALSDGLPDRLGVTGASVPVLTENHTFSIRSRSPVLSGDILVANNPVVAVSGSITGTIAVGGRGVIWKPDSPNTFSPVMNTFITRYEPTASLSGLFSNFPFPDVTSGAIGSTTYYDGRLDVIANASNINSLWKKSNNAPLVTINGASATGPGYDCDGAGTLQLDLSEPQLQYVQITGNISTLILDGQASTPDFNAAAGYRAMLIVVNQASGDLTTVQLNNRSNRRLALAIRKTTETTTVFNAPQAGVDWWRLVLTLEGTPATWTTPGGTNLQIKGGIQTNRALAATGGSISITTEDAPFFLDRITARDAWVENFEKENN